VLPESLPPSRRRPLSLRGASPFGAFSLLRGRRELRGLSAVNMLSFVANEVLPATFVLYAGHRYGWNARTIGLALAGVGLVSAFVQAVLVKAVSARLGERSATLVALLAGTLGFIVCGFAVHERLFMVGLVLLTVWGISNATVQSMMSKQISANDQGRLQGALTTLRSFSGLIGPGLFTLVFAQGIGAGEALVGAPYLLAALLVGTAAVLAAVVTRAERRTVVRQSA
jgi:MFS transporter, DHA1 family, tetracycline resistance protein